MGFFPPIKMKRARSADAINGQELENVPLAARDTVAKIARAFIGDGGTQRDFSALCEKADLRVPTSTLSRWIVNLDAHGAALPGGEDRGRPKALSDEETRLLVGYILFGNANNLKISLLDAHTFVCEELHLDVVQSTTHNYVTDQGFTSRKMKVKASGYKLNRSEMSDLAFGWLQKNWRLLKLGEVWCIDCTFTGHRTDVYYSYALAGSPQPLLADNISRFTDVIVTACSSLGHFYKPVAFTYNQAARRDRNPSARRTAQIKKLNEILSAENVEPYQLVYVGKLTGEKRNIVPASPDVVRRFLDFYEIEPGQLWLSDNGKEFFPVNGSVLEEHGLKHKGFIAAVHQYQSTCDNYWFGASKRKWRTRGLDYSDGITSTVALLSDITASAVDCGAWFDRNLQLNRDAPDRELVSDLIGEKKAFESDYYRDCMYEYCVTFNKDGRALLNPGDGDQLDGRYWQVE
jgi:hypothetical protein